MRKSSDDFSLFADSLLCPVVPLIALYCSCIEILPVYVVEAQVYAVLWGYRLPPKVLYVWLVPLRCDLVHECKDLRLPVLAQDRLREIRKPMLCLLELRFGLEHTSPLGSYCRVLVLLVVRHCQTPQTSSITGSATPPPELPPAINSVTIAPRKNALKMVVM